MRVLKALLRSTIRKGRLTVLGASPQPIVVGPDDGSGPEVAIRLRGALTPLKLAANPELTLGEAYMSGDLVIEQGSLDDLFELIGLNLANRPPPSPVGLALRRWLSRRPGAQNISASARNVRHHYDLSERFYELFLDPQMQYSCAYFAEPGMSLAAAQQAKIDHILAKLDIRPNQRVLDIGCGWGGLALEIARTYQARVTGITLSREQLQVAQRQAQALGLADRVTFSLMDYRSMPGKFERIVSVGMFEHVGPQHYRTFFETVRKLLTSDGVALLHSIGARIDGGGSSPWIRKYIFPGGYIPTLSEVLGAAEPTGLWVCDVEVLRLHYAQTLEHWLERFRAQRAKAKALYDEQFCRMWEFYLASCAMGLRHGDLMVMQVQLSPQVGALPTTRAYIRQAEQRLREQRRGDRLGALNRVAAE